MAQVEEMDIDEITLEGDPIDDETYEIWLSDLQQTLQTEEKIISNSNEQIDILNSYYNYYYYSLYDLVINFSYDNNLDKYIEKIDIIIKKLCGLIFCKLCVDKKKYIITELPNSTIYDIKYIVYKNFTIPSSRMNMIEELNPYISKKNFKHDKSNNLRIISSNKQKLLRMEYNLSKKLMNNKNYYPTKYQEFNKKFFEIIIDSYNIIFVELFRQYHPTDFSEKLHYLNKEKTLEKSNYNINLFNIFTKKFIIDLKKVGIEMTIYELQKYEI